MLLDTCYLKIASCYLLTGARFFIVATWYLIFATQYLNSDTWFLILLDTCYVLATCYLILAACCLIFAAWYLTIWYIIPNSLYLLFLSSGCMLTHYLLIDTYHLTYNFWYLLPLPEIYYLIHVSWDWPDTWNLIFVTRWLLPNIFYLIPVTWLLLPDSSLLILLPSYQVQPCLPFVLNC